MTRARTATTTDAPSLEDALRASAGTAAPAPGLDAVVALDDGGDGWTARIHDGRIEVEPGLPERFAVRIVADDATLADVVEGRRSGVEAFLKGRLTVRGNLALAMRLDSLFHPGPRRVRWPRFATVRAGGLDTAYLEAGSGSPVILLHGLGATNTSFLPTVWSLSRDRRVIAPDLPGFGESAKPIRSYDAGFYARWLRAFLDEVGVERADLIGNSMGGRVALEMGLRHPRRVDHLVLLCPSPAFIKGREFVRLVQYLRPELALMPLRLPHRQVVRSIRALFAEPSRLPMPWYDAAADEFVRVFSTARGRIAFFSAARQIYLEEPWGERGFWDRLRSLRAPSLFVWGDRDRLVPARFARHVTGALPAAESVVLESCGHVPQYEHPKLTDRMIREFLSR